MENVATFDSMAIVMTFELLANEIFHLCFNFQYIKKSIFDREVIKKIVWSDECCHFNSNKLKIAFQFQSDEFDSDIGQIRLPITRYYQSFSEEGKILDRKVEQKKFNKFNWIKQWRFFLKFFQNDIYSYIFLHVIIQYNLQ